MTPQPQPYKALFAPGRILYSGVVQEALRQVGIQGVALIIRHISGDWGDVDDKRRQVNEWAVTQAYDHNKPIISRYPLSIDTQVVVTTRHVHSPRQRQTTVALSHATDNLPKPQKSKQKRSNKNETQKRKNKKAKTQTYETRRIPGGDPGRHRTHSKRSVRRLEEGRGQ